jgi:hypothetical protein
VTILYDRLAEAGSALLDSLGGHFGGHFGGIRSEPSSRIVSPLR